MGASLFIFAVDRASQFNRHWVAAATWPLTTRAQPARPTPPPAVAPAPRLKLTAEQEYIIREIVLKDLNVPKERSVSETVGDIVPENVELYPLPSEIIQKVPGAQSHKFVVKEDDTIVLVSRATDALRT